jgi:hypothetical protein
LMCSIDGDEMKGFLNFILSSIARIQLVGTFLSMGWP